jgi:hypothetical protein
VYVKVEVAVDVVGSELAEMGLRGVVSSAQRDIQTDSIARVVTGPRRTVCGSRALLTSSQTT